MTKELRAAMVHLAKLCKPGYFGKVIFQIEDGKPQAVVRRKETTKIY